MTSLFQRLFRRTPAVPQPEAVPPDAVADLRAQVQRDLASGFYDEDQILKSAAEVFADEIDPATLRAAAQGALKTALAERRSAQRAWPAVTDCDRLDAAFAALEIQGVVARQNFSCCGTCGASEIWDEIAAFEKAGGRARGYAFYHVQDTDSAVQGHGLYLNYGAVEEGEAAALSVAHEIVADLEAHGLTTRWDGSWNQRIGVDLDWKRRRS